MEGVGEVVVRFRASRFECGVWSVGQYIVAGKEREWWGWMIW